MKRKQQEQQIKGYNNNNNNKPIPCRITFPRSYANAYITNVLVETKCNDCTVTEERNVVHVLVPSKQAKLKVRIILEKGFDIPSTDLFGKEASEQVSVEEDYNAVRHKFVNFIRKCYGELENAERMLAAKDKHGDEFYVKIKPEYRNWNANQSH